MNPIQKVVYMTRLVENVAAFSAEFHSHSRYQEAYDAAGASVEGFPGFWQLCGQIGIAITRAETNGSVNFEKVEWIDFTGLLANFCVNYCIATKKAPKESRIETLILEAYNTLKDQEP